MSNTQSVTDSRSLLFLFQAWGGRVTDVHCESPSQDADNKNTYKGLAVRDCFATIAWCIVSVMNAGRNDGIY